MKPRPFAYARPEDVDDAVATLDQHTAASVLGGGQSLIPALVLGERSADILVDVTRLRELRGIEAQGRILRIGAAEPMWDVERSPLVRRHAPLLVQTLTTVGSPGIRSRATLGGSIAWRDPDSQLPAALVALGAVVQTSRRRLPVESIVCNERAELAPAELVLAVELPLDAPTGHALQLVRRSHITWPAAGAAVAVRATGVRVALFGAARRHLLGAGATGAGALDAALAAIDPSDDEKASAAYRRRVLPVLAGRALEEVRAA